jgi:hypothetical protein
MWAMVEEGRKEEEMHILVWLQTHMNSSNWEWTSICTIILQLRNVSKLFLHPLSYNWKFTRPFPTSTILELRIYKILSYIQHLAILRIYKMHYCTNILLIWSKVLPFHLEKKKSSQICVCQKNDNITQEAKASCMLLQVDQMSFTPSMFISPTKMNSNPTPHLGNLKQVFRFDVLNFLCMPKNESIIQGARAIYIPIHVESISFHTMNS